MEFTDRGINPQDPPPIPSIYSYLADKTLRADSIGSYIGKTHQEFFPDNLRHLHHLYSLPSPNPHDLYEGIQIEIEKEKIREEILISEAARRRVLEAEVRRELMMEKSALLTTGHGFSFRSSPQMDLMIPRGEAKPDGGSLEERITRLLNGKCESARFFETHAPIQTGTIVKPVSQAQGAHEKKKYIFLGNPDESVSGLKKKPVTPPRVNTISNKELGVSEDKPVSEGGHEKQNVLLLHKGQLRNFPEQVLTDAKWGSRLRSPAPSASAKPDENISGSKRKASDFPPSSGGIILHKKTKENWFCDICHINSTSERAHNEHVQGRKHKWKAEAFRAARICSSSTKEHLPDKGTTDAATGPVTLEKYKHMVISGNPIIQKYPFWCELCKVGTLCEKDMSNHEKGRKHMNQLSKSYEKAKHEECVAEDGKDWILSREFGKTENNQELLETAKSENHSDKISVFVCDEAEDEKNATTGNLDGIMDNEFVNPVKTENVQDLVVEAEKSENHWDNMPMFVSDGAEDGTNVIKGDSDGIMKPEENHELVVEMAKTENHSDNFAMLVSDGAEDGKNVMKGDFDVIMKPEDSQELMESARSDNHLDKISMLVSDDAEDGKDVIKGNSHGIIKPEDNQELVVETAKSKSHLDKSSMLVSEDDEDGKNVTIGNFDGIISHGFTDPIITGKNQERFVDTERSENSSDKISMFVIDNAEDEKNERFDGIVNHESMYPIITEDNPELVVETEKSQDHLDNAEDEKIVMENNFDGITNHRFADPVTAENSQQLVVETAKFEDHKDEVVDMMEEDDWSAYIAELENGVTDGMVVDRGDDGGIMSLVENFVLDADL